MLYSEFSKKLLVGLLVGLLLIGVACQAETPPETKEGEALATIRYGGQYYPEEFLLKGMPELWEAEGISVEHILFSSGTENNQALISNAIDVNVGSDSKTVALFNAIPDQALIIATVQRGDRYSTIVRTDSPYQTWADLKGKKVGVRLGSGAEQVLLRYFDQSPELSWDDYEWVNLKVEDMIAALDNGSIEAFTVWEPTPAIAEAQGVGRVIRSYGDIALVPVAIHTTVDCAQNHREELVRFLAAHQAKVDLIENDPDKAAQLAAEAASAQGIEVSAEAFKRIFERVDFSLEVDQEALDSIQDTAQFLAEKEKMDEILEFRWDGSFLEEARELVNR